jgi:hypothetical protein
MSNELTVQTKEQIMESVIIDGDLSKLTSQQRVNYYMKVCESLQLNPYTKPFDYIDLDGKLVLYAKRDATDQLRDKKNISVEPTRREANIDLGIYTVEVKGITPDGRVDFATGIVSIVKEDGEWKQATSGKRYFQGLGTYKPLRGDALANAMMKAETKAKRRVTLSICGLGMMDETEIETTPAIKVVVSETGEILPAPATPQATKAPQESAPASEPTTTGEPVTYTGMTATLGGKNGHKYPSTWVKAVMTNLDKLGGNEFPIDGILQKLNLPQSVDAEAMIDAVNVYLHAKTEQPML